MKTLFQLLLVTLCLTFAVPAGAQKTTEPQPMAKPGESTEPPKPRGAPVATVQQLELPRAGGILIFGADGVGADLAIALVAKNNHVTVVTDDVQKSAELTAAGVTVAKANMSDPESLKSLFTTAPFRVVVSTLGELGMSHRSDADANKHAIDATKSAGLERFIMVSRIGTRDSAGAMPWYVRMPLRLFHGETLDADGVAEDYLRTSGLDYTVIRLGGLLGRPSEGSAVLVADANAYSQVTRGDAAGLLARCIDDDLSIGKVLSAYDPTREGFLALFGMRSKPAS